MKEWMRKHHGYQPGTSPTHRNFESYSTSDTPISRACKTASRSHDSCWISTHRTYCKFFSFFLSFSKAFSFFSLFLPFLEILKMFPFLYFSSLCLSPLYCSLFLLFLYYFPPTILHLTPYHVNPINYPPPPHPQNRPFHRPHPHCSSLGQPPHLPSLSLSPSPSTQTRSHPPSPPMTRQPDPNVPRHRSMSRPCLSRIPAQPAVSERP